MNNPSRPAGGDKVSFRNGISPDDYARRVILHEFDPEVQEQKHNLGNIILSAIVVGTGLWAVLYFGYEPFERWVLDLSVRGKVGLFCYVLVLVYSLFETVATAYGYTSELAKDPDSKYEMETEDHPGLVSMDFIIDGHLAYFGRDGEYEQECEWYRVPETTQPIPVKADLRQLEDYEVSETDLVHHSVENMLVDLDRLVLAVQSPEGLDLNDATSAQIHVPPFFPVDSIRRALEARGYRVGTEWWSYIKKQGTWQNEVAKLAVVVLIGLILLWILI